MNRSPSISDLQALLSVSRGDRQADLVLTNCQIVDVFGNSIIESSIAIFNGAIAGIGDYSGREPIDMEGRYVAPGFIEGHIHIESSKLVPSRFAEIVVTHGTTTVVADPHEIANVLGLEGIRYMLRNSANLPVEILYMLPSCVPATDKETSGAILTANDLLPLLAEPRVIGVAELMNFPGAINGDPNVLAKSLLSGGERPVDGHAPGVRGKALSAYLVSGPGTDHESGELEEAREKLSMGMRVMIRQGSTAKNLKTLLPIVNEFTERRCLFVSDDRRPGDLLEEGHLDYSLNHAIELGLDPMVAIRMATINTAEAFHLHDRGGIRPGWRADLVAFKDLKRIDVDFVFNKGELVFGKDSKQWKSLYSEKQPLKALSIPTLNGMELQIRDTGSRVKVIDVIPNQIVTGSSDELLIGKSGLLEADPDRDIAKLAVIERHHGTGRVGLGFVRGLGIAKGAIASTVAHDSHNLIVAGMDDISMLTAIDALRSSGGGQVATLGDQVLAILPLPIAGLMSDLPVREVALREELLLKEIRTLGSDLDDPLMALSFLALPVIPESKLTDFGLFDVKQFNHVSLYNN